MTGFEGLEVPITKAAEIGGTFRIERDGETVATVEMEKGQMLTGYWIAEDSPHE